MTPSPIFPFGKHKGKRIRAIPQAYLKWVLDNVARLDTDLKSAIAAVVAGRPIPDPEPRGPEEELAAVMRIIGSGNA